MNKKRVPKPEEKKKSFQPKGVSQGPKKEEKGKRPAVELWG